MRPTCKSAEEALGFVMKAIETAGYKPGEDVVLALDPASTEFFKNGSYVYEGEGKTRSKEEQAKYLAELVSRYPIASIEDGMAEDDFDGWKRVTDLIGKKCQLVGDDLMVTNVKRLTECIDKGIANSILVKVNQIGTLTEALAAVETAHKAGYTAVMSHRSGETEDSTIADLAVATNCGQIKTGSVARSDRTAKYNQLLRIEQELGAAGEISRAARRSRRFASSQPGHSGACVPSGTDGRTQCVGVSDITAEWRTAVSRPKPDALSSMRSRTSSKLGSGRRGRRRCGRDCGTNVRSARASSARASCRLRWRGARAPSSRRTPSGSRWRDRAPAPAAASARIRPPAGFGLGHVEAVGVLHERIEAAPARPTARRGHRRRARRRRCPGRSRAASSGAEAVLGDGARPIALDENIGLPQQRCERLAAGGLAQIDLRRELAAPGVDHQRLHRRQMRGRDVEHVGAVGRERAPAHRAGDDARQVQHLDAGERPLARGQRLRRRVADPLDAEQRQARDRAALRMRVPFRERSRCGDRPGRPRRRRPPARRPASRRCARCTEARS